MEAVVKPEPVWLLEDQAVLDGMKREEEEITFIDVKDEFQKTGVHGFRYSIFHNDAGIKEESPISDDRNEDMDFEEHSILAQSSEYFPCYKRSGTTGALQCGEMNIKTDKPDHTVSKLMSCHTEVKRFKCELCNKCFTHRSNLTRHIKIHTGDKSIKCEVCSKWFSQRSHLKDHIRIHTGYKPIKCEVCNKCFTRNNDLTNHVRTHTGEKPFKCELCGKCFTQRAHLTDHIKIHTGVKLIKCEVCNRCFTLRSTLRCHLRIHTGDKPFKCEVCNKCFTQRGNLTVHKRNHTEVNLLNINCAEGALKIVAASQTDWI